MTLRWERDSRRLQDMFGDWREPPEEAISGEVIVPGLDAQQALAKAVAHADEFLTVCDAHLDGLAPLRAAPRGRLD